MISIIIPCFNMKDYLPDAIESALNQSYPKSAYEIIVVDDGSTDGSPEMARNYPVKVISQVNKGLASARNTGIMNAKGDWILPLDADDMLKENAVEVISEYINKTDSDIIAPSFKCFGMNNNEIILAQCGFKDFKEANRIGYFSAFRKSKALEIGGYSPRMHWGYEDYHFWINMLSRGAKLQVLQDVLVLYRVRENSMIVESNKHAEELLNQIYKDFPQLYA